jgi:dihydropteroate synthase
MTTTAEYAHDRPRPGRGRVVLPEGRAAVMGIVNVTPDSFFDGGRTATPDAAMAHARRLIAEGADLLDVGGESTRPGARPVAADEELARVLPVVTALRAETDLPISIDTTKSAVAAAALAAGADIVNDVSAGRLDPAMLPLAARHGAVVVLMHMQGTPATMQEAPAYDDVVAEVAAFLAARARAAEAAGIAAERIWVDPGIGFGKRLEHNLELLAHLERLCALGYPVLVGVSRKSFLAALTGEPVERRLAGSLAAAVSAAARGARIVRVHDVAATRGALAVATAVAAAGAEAGPR